MSPKQPNMNDLLKQAQKMQEQLMEAQQAAADQVVEGHAGGGVVKVTVTGAMEFQSVTIDPAAQNTRAIRAYERVGFRPVGVMRLYERSPGGTWRDALLLDLLAADFQG